MTPREYQISDAYTIPHNMESDAFPTVAEKRRNAICNRDGGASDTPTLLHPLSIRPVCIVCFRVSLALSFDMKVAGNRVFIVFLLVPGLSASTELEKILLGMSRTEFHQEIPGLENCGKFLLDMPCDCENLRLFFFLKEVLFKIYMRTISWECPTKY